MLEGGDPAIFTSDVSTCISYKNTCMLSHKVTVNKHENHWNNLSFLLPWDIYKNVSELNYTAS